MAVIEAVAPRPSAAGARDTGGCMNKEFSDEQVVVGVRAVALAAGLVLRRLRDPNFLAVDATAPTSGGEAPVAAGGGSGWRGLARQGGHLVRQGGQRARQGVAAGLQRLSSERPGSDEWSTLTVDERTEWWLAYLGRATSVVAALPGLAGVVGDKVPTKDLMSVAGQGLLLCAIAGEYGIEDVDAHACLLAQVVLGRDVEHLMGGGRRDAEREARELIAEVEVVSHGSNSRRALASSLISMGRSLQRLHDELDKRPQGHLGQRMAGALPVVGVLGQYQGERRGLMIAAERGRAWCGRRASSPRPGHARSTS